MLHKSMAQKGAMPPRKKLSEDEVAAFLEMRLAGAASGWCGRVRALFDARLGPLYLVGAALASCLLSVCVIAAL
jgi:hypothetical protein